MPKVVAAQQQQRLARYDGHLQRVSRSFAKSIAGLQAPLREWVGLGYLLCRVLDTVEDAPWQDLAAQQRHFAGVLAFAELPPKDVQSVRTWAAGLPPNIDAGERALLHDAPWLFDQLHGLEKGPRQVIVATLRHMGAGMRHYASGRDAKGAVRLRSLLEVNRYCFVVAGVVGQMLTGLLLQAIPDFSPSAAMRRDAVHFGLFLQKVNLLKDQQQDERCGRFWLPDRQQVLRSLHVNAEGAGRYLLAIPQTTPSFRLFCAWSLLLGAYSLQLYDGSSSDRALPRQQSAALYHRLASLVTDDAALAVALADALQSLPSGEATRAPSITCTAVAAEDYAVWQARLGSGVLDIADAHVLGMA